MKLSTSIALLSLTLTPGCAGLTQGWGSVPLERIEYVSPQEKHERNVKSWMGRDINDLVAEAGYPTRTLQAPNGHTVYAWDVSSSYVTPQYETPGTSFTSGNPAYGANTVYIKGSTYGGQTVVSSCSTYFEVDKGNIIVNWRYQGNACVAN